MTAGHGDGSPGLEFGVGAVRRLPGAVAALGGRHAFVVTDPGLRAVGVAERVVGLLEADGLAVTVHDRVEPNPSTATLDRAAAAVRAAAAGGGCVVVALGGGSVLDAAKGIALLATNPGDAEELLAGAALPGLPVVAVPTTAGTGAETNGFGVVEDVRACRKVYVGDASVRPRVSVLDPELTVDLPPGATAATGMDALVHGIESLSSRGANPTSRAYATEALRLVTPALPVAVADGHDLDARAALLMGAHLAGLALTISGLGIVHGIAHATTARTGAVHGLALSAVLTEVMGRLATEARDAYARAAQAMGVDDAARGAGDLAERVGAQRRLRDLGVAAGSVRPIAAGAVADPVSRNTPRTLDEAEVAEVLVACR